MPVIGIYVLGPIRPDQRAALLDGVRFYASLGINLGFALTNCDKALAWDIKLIMPGAVIEWRECFTDHDPMPWGFNGTLADPADWFAYMWTHYQDVGGVDYFSFHNEGWINGWSSEFVRRIGDFERRLIDIALPHCKIAGLVFNVGTPGWPGLADEAHYLDDLAPCFQHMVDRDIPLDTHNYDATAPGTIDLMPRELTVLRFKTITARFPGLKVIAGEMGNSTKVRGDNPTGDGMFGPWTPRYMQAFASLLQPETNFLFGAWWCLCNPEVQRNPGSDWSLDNWESILGWYWDNAKNWL